MFVFSQTARQVENMFCGNLQHNTAAVKLIEITTLVDSQPEWLSLMCGAQNECYLFPIFTANSTIPCLAHTITCSTLSWQQCLPSSSSSSCTSALCCLAITTRKTKIRMHGIWGLIKTLSGKLFGQHESFFSIRREIVLLINLVCECKYVLSVTMVNLWKILKCMDAPEVLIWAHRVTGA